MGEEFHAEALRRRGRGVFKGRSKFPVFPTLPEVSLGEIRHYRIYVSGIVGAAYLTLLRHQDNSSIRQGYFYLAAKVSIKLLAAVLTDEKAVPKD